MSEHKRIAIVDGSGNAQLADVVESSTNPGVFGLVILNADGTDVSGGSGQIIFDAIVAPTGGDYTLPSAAVAAGKKTILVKPGTYVESDVTNITTEGTLILGLDAGSTIWQFAAGKNGVKIQSNYCIIQGITLDGRTNTAANTIGIDDGSTPGIPDLTKGNFNTIRDCIILGPSNSFAVYLSGPSYAAGNATLTGFEANALPEGNRIENCKIESAWNGDGVSISLQKNCHFDNNFVDGSRIAFYMNRNSSCSYNNSVNSAGEGIYIAGPCYENIITGNTITSSATTGIKLQDQVEHTPLLAGQAIKGNTVSNNTLYAPGDIGIALVGSQTNQAIQNNLTANTIELAGNHGIYLQDASENAIDGNNILNPRNDTGNARGSGIYIVARCAKNTITSNTIKDDRSVAQMYSGIAAREETTSTNNVIKGNIISGKNTQRTIWVNPSNWIIEGNHIEGGYYAGIFLEGADFCTVKNNQLLNNTNETNNAYAEIWCNNTATNNIIEGNVITSTAANKARYGIYFQTSADTLNQVGKNQFSGIVTKNIEDAGALNTFFSIDMDSTGNVRNIKSETYGTSNDRSQIQMPHPDGSGGSIFSYSGISGYSATEFSRNNYYDPTAANWKYYDNAKQAATWLLDQDGDAELWQAAAGTQPISTWQMVYRLTTGGAQWLKQQAATPSDPDTGFGALYFKNDGKLYKKIASTETEIGGLSWGSAINGATGTGIAQTMNDNYAAGGIGQSITIGNTQTQALTAMQINMGTANQSHVGIDFFGAAGTPIRFASTSTSAAISSTNWYGIVGGGNWNTNSSVYSSLIFLTNSQNAGSGYNTGMIIQNNSTESFISTSQISFGMGINIYQYGAGGTGLLITGANNVNTNTNGLSNITLSNTQSGESIAQKIDLGTSAQGHTGLLINAKGASSSQRGIKIDLTGGNARGIEIVHGTTGNTTYGIYWSEVNPSGSSNLNRYGIFQNKVNGATNGNGYGIWQDNIAGNLGTGYGLYQNNLSALNSGSGYGVYQGVINNNTSRNCYGIYQSHVSNGGPATGWYVNSLGFSTTSEPNKGKFFSLNSAFSGNASNIVGRTLDLAEILYSRTNTHTTGTVANDYNGLYIKRTTIQNGAGGTQTSAGSVMKLENLATQTAGTLTDAVDVLRLVQSSTISTGNIVQGYKGGTAVFTIDINGNFLTI